MCHYNINSLVANNFTKLSSLEAFNAVHNFDIIYISESFLDSFFSSHDSALLLKGYQLVRGSICIYIKDIVPIKVLNVINLLECFFSEISNENQKYILMPLIRSPT